MGASITEHSKQVALAVDLNEKDDKLAKKLRKEKKAKKKSKENGSSKDEKRKEKKEKKRKKSESGSKEEEKTNKRRKKLSGEHTDDEVEGRTSSSDTSSDEGREEKSKKQIGKGNVPLEKFSLSQATVKALTKRGIESLFPIQALTFNKILSGKDLLGRARTGMGKTLAFALPVIEQVLQSEVDTRKFGRATRVICVAPTRELAAQVAEDFKTCAPDLSTCVIYGGASYIEQQRHLRQGVDVLVGTPGRIIDHIDRQTLKLSGVHHIILDEADRMLDMGFKDDIEKIFKAVADARNNEGTGEDGAKKAQVLLFSATLPKWVVSVTREYMSSDYERVDLVENEDSKASVHVRHLAIPCHWQSKPGTVGDLITMYGNNSGEGRSIVFVSTKKEANELALSTAITQECRVLHGDIPQNQRETTMQAFRDGRFPCLIATDVAARGLDMVVDLVINYEPPTTNFTGRPDVETYVHRSGRTGRAGRSGICVTLFTNKQRETLEEIERKIGNKFEHCGAPSPTDVVKASAEKAAEQLDEVHDQMVELFRDKAKQLIEEKGAEAVVTAALACITGYTKALPKKSLLTGAPGFVTVQFDTSKPVFATRYVWNAVNDDLGESVGNKIRGMTILATSKGTVFDLPEEHVSRIEELMAKSENSPYSFPNVLPAVKAKNQQNGGNGGGYGSANSNSRWGGGRNTSGGKSWGGRGGRGGRGGFGGRGGRGGNSRRSF